MKKLFIMLLLLLPMAVSAQMPTQYPEIGELVVELPWAVVSADSNSQTNQVDTAWFSVAHSDATHYWRTFRFTWDTLFTAETLHVVMEYSANPYGVWKVYDSNIVVPVTGSTSTGYYKQLARLDRDSVYSGSYWRFRCRRGKVAPTTTAFDAINGNIYKMTLKIWPEAVYGAEAEG